jgi:hypothetical protein
MPLAIHQPLQGLFFRNGDHAVALEGSLVGLGIPIPYRGPQRLLLYETAAASMENPPSMPPKLFVDLPADADRVLLLAFHPEGQPLRLVAYGVPSDGLRPGDYRFFNFSKQDVAVRLGEMQFHLPRGADHIVSNRDWQGEYPDLNIQLAADYQGSPKLVFSSVWGHHPEHRSFVFLFDGSHPSMPIVMRKMSDQLPPSPAPAPR